MVKPQLLFVVGCLIGLAGTLADMFFKASFFRRLPAFGYGYRCHADRDLGETPLKEPTFISASTVTSTTLRSLSLARRGGSCRQFLRIAAQRSRLLARTDSGHLYIHVRFLRCCFLLAAFHSREVRCTAHHLTNR